MSDKEPPQKGGDRVGIDPAKVSGSEPFPTFRGTTAAAYPDPSASLVSFDRNELNQILNLYGRMVARGEWRDYAIDFLRDRAVFSIFRRAAEVPLYRIEKIPGPARRQGAYSVVSATGLILKRGHELGRVIGVLDRPLKLVVS